MTSLGAFDGSVKNPDGTMTANPRLCEE
ncbi:hypothetical protein FI146_210001 [Flavobacterium psychrophilum]|nr:hypothetical protein FI146_210001 [Flavobacterium psychrophilum]